MLFLTFLENGTTNFPLERGVGEAGNLEEIGGKKTQKPGLVISGNALLCEKPLVKNFPSERLAGLIKSDRTHWQ